MTDKFRELYKKLNAEQKEAVDAIEGPVMVVAGPGTGKTQVLTLRIANILLKTQLDPGSILALTFTESGAAEMRQRLTSIIGRTAYQLNIFTFHGFCNDLMQSYPEEFLIILGRKPADDIEQIDLLKKVVDQALLKILRPFGEAYYYLREARRMISNLKREGIDPASFLALIEKEERGFKATDDLYYHSGRYQGKMKGKYAEWKKQIDKNLELAQIYKGYQQALTKAKRYDYDDMILEAAQALGNNPEFLLRLQERYQYFMVDEHQDTNNAQNKVLELLSNFFANPNLFVVGDEKQAIFRFQGASLENFLYFKKLYPKVKLITLRKNYRSTQSILDLAQSFIVHNQHKISDVLEGVKEDLLSAAGHPEKKVEIYEFDQEETESYFVAQKISELIKTGVSPEEMAVIYRDNRDALAIADMLDKHGLPFRVESVENILADSDIRKLLNLLRFISDLSLEEKLFEILTIDFLQIPMMDIYRLSFRSSHRSLLEMLANDQELKNLNIEAVEKITALSKKLSSWHQWSKNSTPLVLFETLVRESGFLEHLLAHKNSALGLNRLETLYREMKKMVTNHPQTTLLDFLRYVDNLESHAIGIKVARWGHAPKAVRLMTAHGAKGLEFDHVFIVNGVDGHWGNRRVPQLIKLPNLAIMVGIAANNPSPNPVVERDPRSRGTDGTGSLGLGEGARLLVDDSSSQLDDERRLFYVAITRARKMVYLSYATQGANQKSQWPSPFLEEINPELKEFRKGSDYERQFSRDRQILFQSSRSLGFSVFEKEYLNHLFYHRGLSATALNQYLDCPWRYFYLNLLKIPRAKTKHQMYGTAVHAALRDFFNALNDAAPSKDFLIQRFRKALKEEPFSVVELEQVLTKGVETLTAYYHFYRDRFTDQKTFNEFRVKGAVLEVGEGVKLTGSLDKIEFLLGGREVNVVDYKTGRSRTRRELEGKTKNATGDYKRQLVFYKLLLDESLAFPGKMVSGEIDFVEPDKTGQFRKEKFTIEIEEVDELKKLLLKTADDILNLRFWENRCRDKDCEFCQLRENYTTN